MCRIYAEWTWQLYIIDVNAQNIEYDATRYNMHNIITVFPRHFRKIFGRFPVEFWMTVVVYWDKPQMKSRYNDNVNLDE